MMLLIRIGVRKMAIDYKQKIDKVIHYIGLHLDEELTLDEISQSVCLSKYHFHRIFTVYTGISLQHYIRLLRLKRASHQLIIDKSIRIIDIALAAGFDSHESFTRAFKQLCGKSPREFRNSPNKSGWKKLPLAHIPREESMEVHIKHFDEKRLAVVEHRESPKKLALSIQKLMDWATKQRVSLKPGEAFGFAYDDPEITNPDEFRFDLGLALSKNVIFRDGIVEKRLPMGRYAVATHYGSRESIGTTVYSMYRDWLPQSGEELGDLPCIFCYYNFDHEVAETEHVTECWLLLK